MDSVIAKRRGRQRQGSCSKAGCNEKPTITLQVRLLGYDSKNKHGNKPGAGTFARSRIFCDEHADDLFDRMEQLLDDE